MDFGRERIDKWYLKFRQYFFKYSNGFYELPFLVNSPHVMVQGLATIPFTDYDHDRHLLSSDNPFLKSELIHMEIGKDLSLFLSRSEFKKNIKFKFLYDKYMPVRHYFLRYQIVAKGCENHFALSNGISYSTNTWLFYKPGSSPDNYYFKNTSGTFFTIYFTPEWLELFLDGFDAGERKGMDCFIKSSQEYIMYPDKNVNADHHQLFINTIDAKPKIADTHLPDFGNATYNILTDFVNALNEGLVTDNFFSLSNRESLKIIQAEKYLRKHLVADFPGIDHIADKLGIAQTSLKKGFKLIYGTSIYQYYKREKMQLAAQRLNKDPDIQISHLALEMGYENASKFSAAFKEHAGCTPSEYIKQQEAILA